MRIRFTLLGIVLACVAGAATAQLYRWTDEKGRVHITDTPPPASAKNVQKKKPGAVSAVESQTPFELNQAIRDYPVTLYTSPNCKAPCDAARGVLNKRGVPFKEVQVWEEQSNAELKRVSGGNDVPTLVVGRSVHRGFEPGAYDALLDSARYPRAGLLPPRAQAAPPVPEGYVAQGERPAPPAAEPVRPAAEEPKPSGPYAPGAPPQRAQKK
jgi:glutaredoxin